MDILFLDIDGVLNSTYYNDQLDVFKFYEIKKINLVKKIVEETNCKIVLTSLRLNFQLYENEITDIFKNEGVLVYDTLQTPFTSKVEGINKWLNKHKFINQYVVLDDTNYKQEFHNHFIKVSSYYGLTKNKAKTIIDYFKTSQKLTMLLKEAKQQIIDIIIPCKDIKDLLDKTIDCEDEIYRNYHSICQNINTYISNNTLCNEINNIIYTLHKTSFALEIIFDYNQEEILKEIKKQGFKNKEILELVVVNKDNQYDVDKTIENIKEIILNAISKRQKKEKTFEIRIYKDEKDYKNGISCYCERIKGTIKDANNKAKELANRFNTIYWSIEEFK